MYICLGGQCCIILFCLSPRQLLLYYISHAVTGIYRDSYYCRLLFRILFDLLLSCTIFLFLSLTFLDDFWHLRKKHTFRWLECCCLISALVNHKIAKKALEEEEIKRQWYHDLFSVLLIERSGVCYLENAIAFLAWYLIKRYSYPDVLISVNLTLALLHLSWGQFGQFTIVF